MKKLLALIACLMLCLSLAACGNDQTSSKADDGDTAKTTESAKDEDTTTAPDTADTTEGSTEDTTGSAGSMTMEAFIASIQSQIDEMASSMEGAGLKLNVTARGNSLVYSYQYTIDVGDTSLVKGALEQSMDGMASMFESVLSTMKLAVPDAQSIILEFLDKDGKTIVSKEFK